MIYENSKYDVTIAKIELDKLTPEEDLFYRRARKYFEDGMAWLSFDEFAFGPASPVYRGKKNPQEVIADPLFRVLKNMSIDLGVRQGKIRRSSGSPMRAEHPARHEFSAAAAAAAPARKRAKAV